MSQESSRYVVRVASPEGCCTGSVVRPDDIQRTLDEMSAQGYSYKNLHRTRQCSCGKGIQEVAIMIFEKDSGAS